MTNNDEMPPCQPQPDIDSERPRITGFICGRGCINGEHQWDGPAVRKIMAALPHAQNVAGSLLI